jgi:SAM-dependent methyltransferase
LYFWFCRLYERIRGVLLLFWCLGVGRECPFCGMRLRRFLPDGGEPSELFGKTHVVGGGPVNEAICPFCRSFERERHVYLYLKILTGGFAEGIRILHIAPERNLERVLSRQKHIDYVTGDLNPKRAQVRVDLTAMEFASESFDVVICNHVLEHIPEDRGAMAEILRVLRPGGWAMVQVPIGPQSATQEDSLVESAEERLRLYGQHDHVRLYGGDYTERLESIGFRVTTGSIRGTLGDSCAKRFGLLEDELIYIATKPLVAGVLGRDILAA